MTAPQAAVPRPGGWSALGGILTQLELSSFNPTWGLCLAKGASESQCTVVSRVPALFVSSVVSGHMSFLISLSPS